jgi:hypothetical protein
LFGVVFRQCESKKIVASISIKAESLIQTTPKISLKRIADEQNHFGFEPDARSPLGSLEK